MVSTVDIGRRFEMEAKKILINEGYEIIEESSKENWGSPYDFIVRKNNETLKVEVRGRTWIGDDFVYDVDKIKNEKHLFLLINKIKYTLLEINPIKQELIEEGFDEFCRIIGDKIIFKLIRKGNNYEILIAPELIREFNLKEEEFLVIPKDKIKRVEDDILIIPKNQIKIGRSKIEVLD